MKTTKQLALTVLVLLMGVGVNNVLAFCDAPADPPVTCTGNLACENEGATCSSETGCNCTVKYLSEGCACKISPA